MPTLQEIQKCLVAATELREESLLTIRRLALGRMEADLPTRLELVSRFDGHEREYWVLRTVERALLVHGTAEPFHLPSATRPLVISAQCSVRPEPRVSVPDSAVVTPRGLSADLIIDEYATPEITIPPEQSPHITRCIAIYGVPVRSIAGQSKPLAETRSDAPAPESAPITPPPLSDATSANRRATPTPAWSDPETAEVVAHYAAGDGF